MDGQTKATPLYFSEKLIRLGSSAAICGLTISFLFGEMVDAQSGYFRNWVPIASILPAEYPVASPALALVDTLKNGEWAGADQNQIEAAVGLEEIRLAEKQSPPAADVVPKLEEKPVVIEDRAVVVAAATAEVGTRNLFGKIHVNGPRALLGHFEVVVHESVDSSDNPVGFPAAQKILKSGEENYSIDVPPGVKDQYLFLKYFYGEESTAPVKIIPYSKNPVRANSRPPYDFYIADLLEERKPVAAAEKTINISGRIGAMFSNSGFVPLSDAVVKIRGSAVSAVSNGMGEFTLSVPDFSGEAAIEVVRKDFYPTILALDRKKAGDRLSIELANREVIDKMAGSLGIHQIRSKGILIGHSLDGAGITAAVTNKAQGPFYFGAQGYPLMNDSLRATAENGRFIFFNVEAGVGYLDLHLKGDSVAPVVVSPVEGGGVIYKQLKISDGKIRGRIFNPVAASRNSKSLQPIIGARIRVEGSSEWALSDSIGAFQLPQFRYVSGEPIAIELTADKFYAHRFIVTPGFGESAKSKTLDLNLFAFPSTYINDLANSLDMSLDPYSGLILGNFGTGRSLRVDALADHSTVNGAKDFYFDERGILRGGRSGTHPDYGTFVVFNVPRGRTLLQGVDPAGKIRHYSTVYASPSVVTVEIE